MTHEFMNLPAGVDLEPGRISLTYDQPQQALGKTAGLSNGSGVPQYAPVCLCGMLSQPKSI